MLDGVEDIHDFHLWAISTGKSTLSCHIKSDTPFETLIKIDELCRKKYNLHHNTIQIEGFNDIKHAFKCANDIHD